MPGRHSKEPQKIRFSKKETEWKKYVSFSVLLLVISVVITFVYQGYLEMRVSMPFSRHKLVSEYDKSMFWGTYRPGVYFGLKTREKRPLSVGMMWYYPNELRSLADIRHNCETGDNLNKYGWLAHDGRNFGYQEIQDGSILIATTFLRGKEEDNWIAKIDVKNKAELSTRRKISLIWYVSFESSDDGLVTIQLGGSNYPNIQATSVTLGSALFSFRSQVKTNLDVSSVCLESQGMHKVKEEIAKKFAVRREGNNMKYYLSNSKIKDKCSLGAVMLTFNIPGSIWIDMSNNTVETTSDSFDAQQYEETLEDYFDSFDTRFESIFSLKSKGFNQSEIEFAKAAMSNLIGGIGFFYGSSKVKSEYNENPIPYWKAPLYTAVPSRSFFPRGFLWDEGFHGLVISTWDIDISLDILMHWFDLINADGWIPREQILDNEALAKVPEEFVVQLSANANPPTFFLLLEYILKKYKVELQNPTRFNRMIKLYPRVEAWYQWFNRTQIGSTKGSYRWRGRDPATLELNPKTLTSGLDDFPRASHPDSEERHVDLYCWMLMASRVLAKFSIFLDKKEDSYRDTYNQLSNKDLLDSLHLSPVTNTYADYGLHTDNIVLKYVGENAMREVIKQPKHKFVDSTYGYVNLFPFLMKILPSDSKQLSVVIENIRNPNVLWTEYGIRSLSKQAPLYMERNTKDDPPYWRGQIWININYMILGALKSYSEESGPYQSKALETYVQLRQNIIRNLYKQYIQSGYLWENYNDKTGKGQGCYPFTGWSSLVVLIMAEIY